MPDRQWTRMVLRVVAVGAVAAGLSFGHTGAEAAGRAVPSKLFGMDVQQLASRPVDTGAEALRIWDVGVSWRELQPTPGAIQWAKLDAVVTNAQASGATDITYVLGSTPRWAASRVTRREMYGPGSASYPKRDRYYLSFARQVAQRYQGRITSYQVWNEADLPDFYNGSPERLAALTAKTYKLIKSIDRRAAVGSAGMVPRPGRFGTGSFELRYYAGLKARRWPVDAFVVSMYPERQDPGRRATYLAIARRALGQLRAPRREIWESEANYFSGGRAFPMGAQPRLVARTYIDSMGLGIARSYWYSWETQLRVLGVRMTTPSGQPTAAAVAYRVVKSWMVNRTWLGCKIGRTRVSSCGMLAGGARSTILFTQRGKKAFSLPAGTSAVCELNGSCRPASGGSRVAVGPTPILAVGG